MRYTAFLLLAVLFIPSTLAVPPAHPSVFIGDCEIADSPRNPSCNPQQCVSSGAWCKFNVVTGTCAQHVLKPNEHGVAVPTKQTWERGYREGYSILCAGCLCRRSCPAPKIQNLPDQSHAIASGTIRPEDAVMIQRKPDPGTGPRMSNEALVEVEDAARASRKRPLPEWKADTPVPKSMNRPSSYTPKRPARVSRKHDQATGPRMGHTELAHLAMDESVTSKQRHLRAPYAYGPRGYLYREYGGVLDALDNVSGLPIISEKTAKKLVQPYSAERNRFQHQPDPPTVWHTNARPRRPSVVAPAVLEELAHLAMAKEVSRAERHRRAPYAFSPKGYLYKNYNRILDVVDHEGLRIVSEERAKQLVGGQRAYERQGLDVRKSEAIQSNDADLMTVEDMGWSNEADMVTMEDMGW